MATKTFMTTLCLIRHGETDWNAEGRYQGQADPPLNQRGIAQAHQLAEELKEAKLQVLYSSPLRRATQTAQIIAQTLDIPVITDPRLMEVHLGDWQSHLRSEIQTLAPDLFRRWEMDPWKFSPPGGELLSQVQARVYAATDEIVARHPGEHLGLVLHRVPIALLKIRYQNLDPDSIRSLSFPNTYWEDIQVS